MRTPVDSPTASRPNDRRSPPTRRRVADIPRGSALALLVAATLLAIVALPALSSAGVPSSGLPSPSARPSPGAAETASVAPAGIPTPTSIGSAGWENLTPSVMPSARYGEAMAYDAADAYIVLFGGRLSGPYGGYVNDTWTYANGVWTNITATAGTAPSARGYASLVDDVADGYLVLVSGTCPNSNFCNDTWKFSGGLWSPLGPAPINRLSSDAEAAYDSTDGYVLLVDCVNGTHRFSRGVWATVPGPTPPGCSPSISDDPANHGVMFWGGLQQRIYNATWMYSNGSWQNVTNVSGIPNNAHGAAYTSLACYDPDLGAVLEVSPLVSTENGPYEITETYLYNGTWTNITQPLAPPNDYYGGLAWDTAVDGAVFVELATVQTVWVFSGHPGIADLAVHASDGSVDVGASDSFSATFLGGTSPFTYAWSFGDGATGTGAAPAHAYALAGSYSVGVAVTDSTNATATATLTVQVVTGLATVPSATPDPTEVGLPTTFAAGLTGGVGPLTYDWVFGDGGRDSTAAPAHTYTTAGVYNVSLSTTDQGGAAVSGAFRLVVAPALAVTVSVNPLAPDLGQLTNFTATASGGVGSYRYSWSFGDGGTGGNLSQISHVFTTNGPFVPVVTVVDSAGGSANASTTVNIALNLSVFGNWSMGAAPLPVSFGSHVQGGLPGYSYRWAFGDGAGSSAATPSHTYVQPGYFQATLTVTDAAGTTAQAAWPLYVAVGGAPLEVALVATPAQVVPGGTFVVTAQAAGGSGGYTLHWSTGQAVCTASGIASERCTVGAAAQYPVSVVVADGTGGQAVGSSVVVAGTPATVGPIGGSSPSFTLPPLAVGLLGGAVGAALALAAVTLARRRGGRPGPGASLSLPQPTGPSPEPGHEVDPFDDLV